jgi:hypothetical protein
MACETLFHPMRLHPALDACRNVDKFLGDMPVLCYQIKVFLLGRIQADGLRFLRQMDAEADRREPKAQPAGPAAWDRPPEYGFEIPGIAAKRAGFSTCDVKP